MKYTGKKVYWTFILVILILGSIISVQSTVSAKNVNSNFSKFVGTWYAHGSSLHFFKDGRAAFQERTYRWCGPGVASPCDTIDTRGVIRPGNQEQIQFVHVTGSMAYGTIIASSFHPRRLPVTVALQPDDTLLYASHRPITLLCGSNAPVGMCGA
ncbi:MAG: hypothetical protein ACRDHZ_00365 [Ktedonobacteraceae bacterium]